MLRVKVEQNPRIGGRIERGGGGLLSEVDSAGSFWWRGEFGCINGRKETLQEKVTRFFRKSPAYGGIAEANKSYFGEPPCETIVAGDINGDCRVDFKDFALMAFHWLQDDSPY